MISKQLIDSDFGRFWTQCETIRTIGAVNTIGGLTRGKKLNGYGSLKFKDPTMYVESNKYVKSNIIVRYPLCPSITLCFIRVVEFQIPGKNII